MNDFPSMVLIIDNSQAVNISVIGTLDLTDPNWVISNNNPGTTISLTPSSVTIDNLQNRTTNKTYMQRDFGVNYFGDFEIHMKAMMTSPAPLNVFDYTTRPTCEAASGNWAGCTWQHSPTACETSGIYCRWNPGMGTSGDCETVLPACLRDRFYAYGGLFMLCNNPATTSLYTSINNTDGFSFSFWMSGWRYIDSFDALNNAEHAIYSNPLESIRPPGCWQMDVPYWIKVKRVGGTITVQQYRDAAMTNQVGLITNSNYSTPFRYMVIGFGRDNDNDGKCSFKIEDIEIITP